jgi:hypothetical protein
MALSIGACLADGKVVDLLLGIRRPADYSHTHEELHASFGNQHLNDFRSNSRGRFDFIPDNRPAGPLSEQIADESLLQRITVIE